MAAPLPDPIDFVEAGKKISLEVFQVVKDFYEQNRQANKAKGGKHKDRNNLTREIDKLAQREAEYQIKRMENVQNHKILILGEEKEQYPESLENCKTLVAFVDPIDGTDLVVRGFGNWCLALLFYYPPQRRILASIIGHSSGEVYYATEKGAFKESRFITTDAGGTTVRYVPKALHRDVRQPVRIEDAGICFYGQKPKNFLAFTRPKMLNVLKELKKRMAGKNGNAGETINMRLYNFGGNPMMAKLASGDVDAVLGLWPGQVHDIMPGAYIAKQAGAIFTDLRNSDVDLGQQLLFPQKKLAYILTASRQLHDQLHNLVGRI